MKKNKSAEEEAIVEAVLFTMGKSVETRQLAAALRADMDTAREAALRLKKRRSPAWRIAGRCAPGPNTMKT